MIQKLISVALRGSRPAGRQARNDGKFFLQWPRIAMIVLLFFIVPSRVEAYDDQGWRDPFWPLISASGTIINYGEDISPSDMVLEGILSDGADKYIAIINGNIVKPGDAVGAFTIDRIEPKIVYFIKGSETFELNLKNGGE